MSEDGASAYYGGHEVQRVSLSDGAVTAAWRDLGPEGAAYFAPPALAPGAIVSAAVGRVVSIGRDLREVKWSSVMPGASRSHPFPPSVIQGRIIASTDDAIGCFRSLDGKLLWSRVLGPDELLAQPAASSDGVVYVSDGRVECLSLSDGRVVWTRSLGGAASYVMPVIDAGSVFVVRMPSSTQASSVVKMSAKSGDILWARPANGTSISPPVLTEESIWVVCDGAPCGYRKADGRAEVLSATVSDGQLFCAAYTTDGGVVTISVLSTVRCLSHDGASDWSIECQDAVFRASAPTDKLFLVTTTRGVVAIRDALGDAESSSDRVIFR